MARSTGLFYVRDVADGTGTGVFLPQRETKDKVGNVVRSDANPFGSSTKIGYQIELDTTGTVEIRGGSGAGQEILRTVTTDDSNFVVGPYPVLDFNITANGNGIRIRCWGINN